MATPNLFKRGLTQYAGLRGKPLTYQEARGFSDPYYENLSKTNIGLAQIGADRAFNDRRLAESSKQFSQGLALDRERLAAEREAQEAAGKAAGVQGLTQVGLAGASIYKSGLPTKLMDTGRMALEKAGLMKSPAQIATESQGAFVPPASGVPASGAPSLMGAPVGSAVPSATAPAFTGLGPSAEFAPAYAEAVGGGTVAGAETGAVAGGGVAAAEGGAGSGAAAAGAGKAGLTVGGALGSAAGGYAAGQVGKMITGFGQEGHMGGEQYTSAAIGGLGGVGVAALIGTGPVGWAIGGIVGLVSGGSDSVICTELYRQGYMSLEMLVLDSEFGRGVDDEVYSGYRKIANPIVSVMQKSKTFTWLISKPAMAWARHMCYEMRPEEYKADIIGKIIMKIGMPLCRFIGKEVSYGAFR